jgi:hypothetical protein
MPKLNEKAILINVNLKKWGGTKVDKSLSEQIGANHNVDENQFSVTKKLTNNEWLKKIKKIDGQIRTDCIYSGAGYTGHCFAWDNQGTFMLPIDAKELFEKKFASYRDKRDVAVKNFIKEYPSIVEDAKADLGSTYKDSDFPCETTIEEYFACEVIKKPIPSTDDIRVNLSAEEIKELKDNAKASEDAKMLEITDSVVEKIQGVLGHFSEKIKSGEVFRDSTLNKVKALCETLPSLNVASDPKIHDAHQKLMDIFAGNNISPESLREDKDKAKDVADKSDAIISDLDGWLND